MSDIVEHAEYTCGEVVKDGKDAAVEIHRHHQGQIINVMAVVALDGTLMCVPTGDVLWEGPVEQERARAIMADCVEKIQKVML